MNVRGEIPETASTGATGAGAPRHCPNNSLQPGRPVDGYGVTEEEKHQQSICIKASLGLQLRGQEAHLLMLWEEGAPDYGNRGACWDIVNSPFFV